MDRAQLGIGRHDVEGARDQPARGGEGGHDLGPDRRCHQGEDDRDVGDVPLGVDGIVGPDDGERDRRAPGIDEVGAESLDLTHEARHAPGVTRGVAQDELERDLASGEIVLKAALDIRPAAERDHVDPERRHLRARRRQPQRQGSGRARGECRAARHGARRHRSLPREPAASGTAPSPPEITRKTKEPTNTMPLTAAMATPKP